MQVLASMFNVLVDETEINASNEYGTVGWSEAGLLMSKKKTIRWRDGNHVAE